MKPKWKSQLLSVSLYESSYLSNFNSFSTRDFTATKLVLPWPIEPVHSLFNFSFLKSSFSTGWSFIFLLWTPPSLIWHSAYTTLYCSLTYYTCVLFILHCVLCNISAFYLHRMTVCSLKQGIKFIFLCVCSNYVQSWRKEVLDECYYINSGLNEVVRFTRNRRFEKK